MSDEEEGLVVRHGDDGELSIGIERAFVTVRDIRRMTREQADECPLGTVATAPLMASEVPDGWVACDGQELDKNEYPELVEMMLEHMRGRHALMLEQTKHLQLGRGETTWPYTCESCGHGQVPSGPCEACGEHTAYTPIEQDVMVGKGIPDPKALALAVEGKRPLPPPSFDEITEVRIADLNTEARASALDPQGGVKPLGGGTFRGQNMPRVYKARPIVNATLAEQYLVKAKPSPKELAAARDTKQLESL